MRAFSSCGKQGLLFIALCGLLIVEASLVAEHGTRFSHFSSCSVVVVHRLSCSAAYGIFLHQGLNPCPLCWQMDFFFFLEDGFLTTRPPGKSLERLIFSNG